MTNGADTQLMHSLDRVLEESSSDQEREQFSQLLDENPELARLVIDQLQTDALLKWSFSPSLPNVTVGSHEADEATTAACSPDSPTRVARRRSWKFAVGVAVAASLAGLLAFSWFNQTAPRTLGEVLASNNVEFGASCTALGPDQKITAGILEITSGKLSLELSNGVTMSLRGPTQCRFDSDMLVELVRGQATADVPRWARGFTITTSDIEVVDLGTRFGVAKLGDATTDVVVFEGEVDLKSLGTADKQFARRLTQGEAARINRIGKIERIFQVHGEANDDSWSTLEPDSQDGVIAAVWDNLGATKSVSYYQVIPRGLDEDVHAYVDHPHQWNGLTSEGIPPLLLGADYVRTVNDYRYLNELSIEVEFAADATLFIIYDDRSELPDWLTSQFEDTGFDIGLDEDAWGGNPTFTVAEGPAESIDNTFSVWRRPCAAGETMTLGSMRVGREARAMYGIAATPR